ncbi:unnamed protein product [Linum tenue]|uniref:GDSL esterase/lipase n=1 Tax=Linum tenue TaxID=586396 RepID=A0AAV0LY22_9ROSI|nr:unnamed protein product [Linum tenue]
MAGRNAIPPAVISTVLVLLLLSLASSSSSAAGRPAGGPITSIFSFGDSIADTGNHCYLLFRAGKRANNCFLPYGETFFRRPTGRSCDGRLIIDFIAEHLGLPLVPPYFGGSAGNFRGGVNFAVGTATALHTDFLTARLGVEITTTNVSLGVQLDLFKQLLPSLCCRHLFNNSLFILGEIGGNDYNLPLTDGNRFNDIQQLVPIVVGYIGFVLREIIELGAVNILVPGNFPIGCLPFYLAKFRGSSSMEYDPFTGCLAQLNKLSEYHNELLQAELSRTRRLYPDINIIYVDYYNAVLRIYQAPEQFGEGSVQCGSPSVKPCDDSSKYVNWDGLHFTEATYGSVARSILEEGLFTHPSFILSSSSRIARDSGDYFPNSF